MIYSNFTGRVAKKAKVIDGVNGQFLSMDMAVNDYSKGEETTQWVRVQSSDPAHLKLVEYFTKGRILTIQGNVKIDQWEGKDGTPHAQLRVHAKYIDFLNIVKNHEIDIEEIFEDDRLERASRRVLEAEAKRIIRKELEMNYQTQGYSTNYDIEVWNVNDWG